MSRVCQVKALEGYQLEVVFADGTQGVVSLEGRLFGPVFEPLRDPGAFRQVRIDEFGAICWPSGADLAPDGVYAEISSKIPRDAPV